MSRIPPVPTTRINGLLARQRLTQQYQNDQLDLFRLQEQISTGLRITLPSEDAPAALRAISFQRLLSRKEQLGSNIDSGLLFLGSTDATLGGAQGVANVLGKIKADTLGVVGTVSTDKERQAAIADINGALDSLVTLANRQFNGRYLFSGSQTNVQPYSFRDGNVLYSGDDREIRNFSDIGVLFSSNISGQEVFGGISEAVEGTVDLNPELDADTLLSSLRGGRGINPNGSLQITNTSNNNTSVVDLSSASTIGDLVKLIEDNPPAASQVDVTISGDGLQIEMPGGTLVISEVGAGTAARELGVLGSGAGVPSTILSDDLDPRLLKTTLLEDILGTKARATLSSVGDSNDIHIEANQNGTALNGVTIEVFDGGNIGATANVIYNGGTTTLEIYVDDDGETTANHIVDAINFDPNFEFSATNDVGDSITLAAVGTGNVPIGVFPNVTSGGSGTVLDQDSGVRIVNGDETYDIIFTGDETVEDLLNRLNRSEAGVEAEINATGTGINIRSRLSGNDFQIGEINGGTTATQLGLRTFTTDSQLKDFNFGVGVPTSGGFDLPTGTGDDFTIDTIDGLQFGVDLSGLNLDGLSATDAINLIVAEINTASVGAGASVTASAVTTGNVTAVQLDDAGVGLNPFTVSLGPAASLATKYLGLIPDDNSTQTVSAGTTITGNSSNYVDLTITAESGQSFDVDLSATTTVGEVLAAINTATGGVVGAQLAASGNGIELIDTTFVAGPLTVTAAEGNRAAEFLGLLANGTTSATSVTGTLTGSDRNSVETESVFNTLIRLRDALEANDNVNDVERAASQLEKDIERVTFGQADVGTRFRNLELSKFNLEDEEIQLKGALSEEIDVDLVDAISQMTARQISLEASLRASANILQLSLLDFI